MDTQPQKMPSKLFFYAAQNLAAEVDSTAEMIKKSLTLRDEAERFTKELVKTPTEILVATWMTDYYEKFPSFVADAERVTYTPSKEYEGLWERNDHITLTDAITFLRAMIHAARDIALGTGGTDDGKKKPSKKEIKKPDASDDLKRKAYDQAERLLDRFASVSKYNALKELIINNLPKTQMNAERCILFANGVAWNGKRIITDIEEISSYHLTSICKHSLPTDFEAFWKDNTEAYNRVIEYIRSVGNYDQNNIEDITSWLGYLMTLHNYQKKFFVFWGRTTNNGKSTLLALVSTALGNDFSAKLTPQAFAKPTFASKQEFSSIGKADGKILAYASEPDRYMTYDAGFIKDITNGVDKIVYSRKYSTDGEMTCDFIPVQECNNIPRYDDDSLIDSGRITILSFENKFPEGDKPLTKQWTDTEYSILLTLCVKSAMDTDIFTWHNAARNEYIRNNDTVAMFVEDCCRHSDYCDADKDTETKTAYKIYCEYVKATFPATDDNVTVKPVPQGKFNEGVERAGYPIKRPTIGGFRYKVFEGLTLKD